MIEKVCSYCGKTFMAKTNRAMYCSHECRLGNRRDKLRSEYVSQAKHIKRVCPQCGKEFISNTAKQIFCCEECQLNHHGIHLAQATEKKCVICGKMFETKMEWQTTCSRKCSEENKKLKDKERYARRWINKCGGKTAGERRLEEIKNNLPEGTSIEYERREGNYIFIGLKCSLCGTVSEYCVTKNLSLFKCEGCRIKKIAEYEKESKARRETRKCKKLARKIWLSVHPGSTPFYKEERVCVECGETFTAYRKDTKYCSDACQKRAAHRHAAKHYKDRCKPGKYIDVGINAKTVADRDNNICYICGKPVDWNDCYRDTNGNFVAGKNYPSVDHVFPLSKGGTHSWDNVKLAHHHCNTKKRDSIITKGESA